MANRPEKEIVVGLSHQKTFNVTAENLYAFRQMVGDTHPIHSDSRGIVFGAITWGFVSSALTEMLGDNYICDVQRGSFVMPLLIGHEARIVLSISEVIARQRVVVQAEVRYTQKTARLILTGTMEMRPLL